MRLIGHLNESQDIARCPLPGVQYYFGRWLLQPPPPAPPPPPPPPRAKGSRDFQARPCLFRGGVHRGAGQKEVPLGGRQICAVHAGAAGVFWQRCLLLPSPNNLLVSCIGFPKGMALRKWVMKFGRIHLSVSFLSFISRIFCRLCCSSQCARSLNCVCLWSTRDIENPGDTKEPT